MNNGKTMAPLNERAVLVTFSANSFYDRTFNADVSARVAQDANAESERVGRYNQNIFGVKSRELAACNAVVGAQRMHLNRVTLPWLSDGTRVMPAAIYLDFSKEAVAREREFWLSVDKFINVYDELVRNAPAKLGALASACSYPSCEEARTKFGWQIGVYPIPTSNDFRVSLGNPEVEAAIAARVDEQVREQIAGSVRDVWAKLLKPIQHMVEKLGDPEAIFRDTLVENVREVCALAPALNLQDDPQITTMVQTIMEKLTAHHPDTLREDATVRQNVASEAKRIAARMRSLLND